MVERGLLMALAELDDVQRLLPDHPIPDSSHPFVEALIEEAGDLIEAYCRTTFGAHVPGKIRRVAARMAARAYAQQVDGVGVPEGTTSTSVSAGPFSRSFGFDSGSTTSGVWLSANDKHRLRGYRARVFTIYPY